MPNEYVYTGKWELLTENTYRMAVPEGWIVRDMHSLICGDRSCSVSMQGWKILDPDHTWKISK